MSWRGYSRLMTMLNLSRVVWLLALLPAPVASHSHGAHECNHEHDSTDSGAFVHSYPNGVGQQVLQQAPKEHQHQHHHESHQHVHEHQDHDHGYEQSPAHYEKEDVLPEELAEEEELAQHGFRSQRRVPTEKSNLSVVWLSALGCSLLVSTASLICLMLLPFILSNGRPSAAVVDALAGFGAGAMLGDAFLHQLPHAFGSASHAEHEHSHQHDHGHESRGAHGHAHSIQDLSLGLSVLAGILLFFVVEKLVRYVEEKSGRTGASLGHGHHHLHHHKVPSVANAADNAQEANGKEVKETTGKSKGDKDETVGHTTGMIGEDEGSAAQKEQVATGRTASGWVLAYLNLFSDGVHNFTDGMALGSAFLLHGSVGGWSRTLFLLAHELPQEVGDFGILVRSGLSVAKALTFNFLSALLAVAGTALALLLGGNPGHSSLIEGFTAGGFIYISVAGVLPAMHDQGSSPRITLMQVASLSVGVGVAMAISLAE